MNTSRNYNIEAQDVSSHKYAYGFDLDVIHKYMLKSFIPFFKDGNILELGSYKGDFTARLLEHFDKVVCIEVASEVAEEAKLRLGSRVEMIVSTFNDAVLDTKYDNIILTHVLEHIDDPVDVLNKINDEWLDDTGRLFLVCPNANAASRQIAVKMGLITHPEAITTAELSHGHKRTYTLNTLERDVTMSGLKVIHRSGIFFKALASYQLDKVIENNIISTEYLEGCYQLGQQYPDLCSSIFLVCERG